MLDMNFIRENPELVKEDLKKRQDEEKIKWIDEILELDTRWKTYKKQIDDLRHKRNQLSQDINIAKKEGKDVADILKVAKDIPAEIEDLEFKASEAQEKIRHYRLRLPNMMHESVPVGKDDTENKVIKTWGEPKNFDFELKSHAELVEELGLADFKRAVKISGAGFNFLKGDLAMLDRALMNFAIDHMTGKGHTLVAPPLMMRRDAYEGVTSLDDFENVMYRTVEDDLHLIATSEHPLTAQYKDEVLDEKELPIKLVGSSPCFRKEIGSHGVDTKGLFRMHQFNKVEQIIICKPEDSWKYHEELQKNSEEIMEALEIPYQVVNVCTGDLGIIAAKKYDIEAWYPRQNKYGEVKSNSNCTSYQSVRLNLRYQKDKERVYVHTLNNTALATSRMMVAILENYQNADGTVDVPIVLQKYMNGIQKLRKANN